MIVIRSTRTHDIVNTVVARAVEVSRCTSYKGRACCSYETIVAFSVQTRVERLEAANVISLIRIIVVHWGMD